MIQNKVQEEYYKKVQEDWENQLNENKIQLELAEKTSKQLLSETNELSYLVSTVNMLNKNQKYQLEKFRFENKDKPELQKNNYVQYFPKTLSFRNAEVFYTQKGKSKINQSDKNTIQLPIQEYMNLTEKLKTYLEKIQELELDNVKLYEQKYKKKSQFDQDQKNIFIQEQTQKEIEALKKIRDHQDHTIDNLKKEIMALQEEIKLLKLDQLKNFQEKEENDKRLDSIQIKLQDFGKKEKNQKESLTPRSQSVQKNNNFLNKNEESNNIENQQNIEQSSKRGEFVKNQVQNKSESECEFNFIPLKRSNSYIMKEMIKKNDEKLEFQKSALRKEKSENSGKINENNYYSQDSNYNKTVKQENNFEVNEFSFDQKLTVEKGASKDFQNINKLQNQSKMNQIITIKNKNIEEQDSQTELNQNKGNKNSQSNLLNNVFTNYNKIHQDMAELKSNSTKNNKNSMNNDFRQVRQFIYSPNQKSPEQINNQNKDISQLIKKLLAKNEENSLSNQILGVIQILENYQELDQIENLKTYLSKSKEIESEKNKNLKINQYLSSQGETSYYGKQMQRIYQKDLNQDKNLQEIKYNFLKFLNNYYGV